MSFSQYKDKQVMGLSGTQSGDLLDLMSTPLDEHYRGNGGEGGFREEIGQNYDFQQGRNVFGSSSPPPASGGRSWGDGDSRAMASGYRNYSSLEPLESSIVTRERAQDTYEVATVAEIDRIMKKHVDTLLDELEDVRTRFSQFEIRTRNLESSVGDLKVSVKNSAGATDGKLRQLEHILREVQSDVQTLRDKQEIAEAQLQLAKLQALKEDRQTSNTTDSDSQQQSAPLDRTAQQPQLPFVPPRQVPSSPLPAPPASNAPPPPPPQQPIQQPYLPVASQQTAFPHHPTIPTPNVPPPPPPQQNPSLVQEFSSAGQSQHTTPLQYQTLVQPPPSPPQQHYGSPPQQHYGSPPQQQASQYRPPGPPTQPQSPFPQHPEETPPYIPQPQVYPLNIRQPTLNQHRSGPPPSPPQFYDTNTNMYESPTSRAGSGHFPYHAGFPEPYPLDGLSPRYGNSRPPQFLSGESSNSHLPVAEVLPRAEPNSSDTTRTRVPIDDVVDQVAKMGFSRDQVRAIVRKLTENGQSVDLNVVLDKLMNDSDVIQPQNIWHG